MNSMNSVDWVEFKSEVRHGDTVNSMHTYRRTFSTTFATLAVATRSPSQLHCIKFVGTAQT